MAHVCAPGCISSEWKAYIDVLGAYGGGHGCGWLLLSFRGIFEALESQSLGLVNTQHTYSQMVAALDHEIDDVRVLGALYILAVDFEQSVILAQPPEYAAPTATGKHVST